MIRYRRSPNRKPYRQTIGGIHNEIPSEAQGNRKVPGSGGSIVARPKLKGIDGKAPPGVESAAQFDSTRGNSPRQDSVMIDRLRVLS